jgi:two-component system sensor histidine kinase DesK
VDANVEQAGPAVPRWADGQRKWTRGWRRIVFPGVLLAYLFYVAGAVGQYSHGAAAISGYAILAAFAACYLLSFAQASDKLRSGQGQGPWPGIPAGSWRFRVTFCVLAALFLAELPLAHAAAFVMAIFITIVTVAHLGARSLPIVVVLTLAAIFVPPAVPSWHDTIGSALGDVTPVAIPVVALSVFGALQAQRSHRALMDAREQLAHLAAENERIRIARDLHDLLGHSLTTITVKAGLACRLGQTDPARALAEMAEVEDLARRSLADVRATVASYRDVTLAGELATGRELLRAAGITADLPRAVDMVAPAHQELFGWVVREGLTNIVRHAHASSCAVRLSASSVEIVDDGVGGPAAPGNGLRGLRERVTAAGGVVDAGPLQPAGWRLRVSLAPAAGA